MKAVFCSALLNKQYKIDVFGQILSDYKILPRMLQNRINFMVLKFGF